MPFADRGSFLKRTAKQALLRPILVNGRVRRAFDEMTASAPFGRPRRWREVSDRDIAERYDAVYFTGGEGPGMLEFLDAPEAQDLATRFQRSGKLVAALCHGVFVPARATDAEGNSLLLDRTATTLPRFMETLGAVAFRILGRPRIYRPTWAADVIREAVGKGGRYERGPLTLRAFHRGDRRAVVLDTSKPGGAIMTSRSPQSAEALGWAMADYLHALPARAARTAPARVRAAR